MSTLFISHKSIDRDNLVATDLMARLKQLKHNSLFLDLDEEKGIVGGRSWEQTLYRNVRACRAVIALVSNDYLRSHWCFAELALARMEGKHLIPLEIEPLDDTLIPQILTGTQRINLYADSEAGFARLFKALEELDVLGEEGDWDPKQSPYLGLSTFEEKHAPLFFGRDDEIRVGIELLDRGAPGLVMVLGSSGSGKSSLVRAGIVPRLRRNEDRWLVVGPFRPRRDPFAELAEALANAYRRYAPEEAKESGSRVRLRERLGADRAPSTPAGAEGEDGPGDPAAPLAADVRVRRLLDQLEELSREPPVAGGSPLRSFLDLSLGELRQMCAGKPAEATGEPPPAGSPDLVEIADELRRASGHESARVLLVVDQFEELLGRGASGNRANRFLEMVREAIETADGPLVALGTMRSDFLGLFQQNRALLGIDYENLSVGPMSEDGLTRVIVKPAERGALTLDDGIASLLVKDTETPDALPLLSFTLLALWEQRDENGRLRLDQYKQLGGLQGAITREAQAILDQHRTQEDDVRRAFLEMARLTEDGNYVREAVSWQDERIAAVEPILRKFVSRRLLVTAQEEGGEATVEVAHEALFRSWPPLVSWLDENRSEQLLKAQLRRDAGAWEEGGRGAELLWRGGRLQQAAELMRRSARAGSGKKRSIEAEFVRAGVGRRWWTRMIGTTIVTGIVIALTFLWVTAALAKRDAERQANVAMARQLAAQAELEQHSQLERAVLLAIESIRRCPSSEASQLLASAVMRLPIGGAPIRHGGIVNALAFSPDGELLASGSDDGTVKIVETESSQQVGEPLVLGGRVLDVAFHPRGGHVAAAGFNGVAMLWRMDTRDPLWSKDDFPAKRIPKLKFSSDGDYLAVLTKYDTDLIVFRLEDDRVYPHITLPHGGMIYDFTFSPDGRFVLTAGGVPGKQEAGPGLATVFCVDDGQVIQRLPHAGIVAHAAFSSAGNLLALASYDNTVSVWDARSFSPVREPLAHERRVSWVAFSPDGRTLTAATGNELTLWDTSSWQRRRIPSALDDIWGIAYGPGIGGASDGTVDSDHVPPATSRFAVFGGSSSFAQLWDPVAGREVARPHHGNAVGRVVFSPDGRFFATASDDETARIWEVVATGAGGYLDHTQRVHGVRFSPDGRLLATASEDGYARIWDVNSARLLLMLPHKRPVRQIEFSLDGRLVATRVSIGSGESELERAVHVWNVTTGEAVDRLVHGGEVWEIAFSGADPRIATTGEDRGAHLWAVKSAADVKASPAARSVQLEPGEELRRFAPNDGFRNLALTPDGRLLAGIVASDSATREDAAVWAVESGAEVFRLSRASGDQLAASSLAFRPDGGQLAIASVTEAESSRLSIFDPAGWLELSSFDLDEPAWNLRYSPDGLLLATWGTGTGAVIWSSGDLKKIASVPHDGDARDLAFSPDSAFLATAGSDSMAKVWSVEDDREAFAVFHRSKAVTQVGISPDGRMLATAGEDGVATLLLWKRQDLVAEARRRLTRELSPEEWERFLPDEDSRTQVSHLAPTGSLDGN